MQRLELTIPGMDCPSEEALIRNQLAGVSGVAGTEFDLLNRRVVIRHSLPDAATILAALEAIGMRPQDGSRPATTPGRPGGTRQLLAFAAGGALALGGEVAALSGLGERHLLIVAMAVASIALCGMPTLRKGFIALRTFTLNISFLMSVAVIGAASIGEWPEAAMVVFLFAVAERIEVGALDRARNAVRSLMALAPERALVRQADGAWQEQRAAAVAAGSIIRIHPGERVPLDGVVIAGASTVDQAPITGESLPVDKGPGAQVFAGTINVQGVLEARTTGGRDETTLARIVKTVQEAQGQRAPTQRFVDTFARVYTPVVCLLAVLVATLPWAVFAEPFFPWLYRALVLLVIACPCALVISTPVTIVSGLAAAARRGILVKGGMHLEAGRKLRAVALDKTGTITEGRPRLTDVVPLNGRNREDVLQLAASLDALSDHPVARAVVEGWKGRVLPVVDFESLTGRGVTGTIAGEKLWLGNHRLLEEVRACGPAVEAVLLGLEAQGKTAVVLTTARAPLAVLAVADAPRPTSVEAVRRLHGLGLRIVMLTGDNRQTGESIARIVGIDDVRGDLLPADKLLAMDDLLAGHRYVAMVGDGVNDAPAMAKATIGFAMGKAGTDTALEVADVALMRDDLRGLVEFIELSQRTHAVLIQNIAFALSTKVAFFGLAVVGVANLWMAVAADMGASLVVILNGLRLLGDAAPGSRTTPQTPVHA